MRYAVAGGCGVDADAPLAKRHVRGVEAARAMAATGLVGPSSATTKSRGRSELSGIALELIASITAKPSVRPVPGARRDGGVVRPDRGHSGRPLRPGREVRSPRAWSAVECDAQVRNARAIRSVDRCPDRDIGGRTMAMPDTVPTTSGITLSHTALGAAASAKTGSDGPGSITAPFVRAILPSDQAVAILGGFCTDALHASPMSHLAAPRAVTSRGADVSACRPCRSGRRLLMPTPASTAGAARVRFGQSDLHAGPDGAAHPDAHFTSSTYRVRPTLPRR